MKANKKGFEVNYKVHFLPIIRKVRISENPGETLFFKNLFIDCTPNIVYSRS